MSGSVKVWMHPTPRFIHRCSVITTKLIKIPPVHQACHALHHKVQTRYRTGDKKHNWSGSQRSEIRRSRKPMRYLFTSSYDLRGTSVSQSDRSSTDELVSSCFSPLRGVEKLCHGLPNGNCPGRWEAALSACWYLRGSEWRPEEQQQQRCRDGREEGDFTLSFFQISSSYKN